MSDNNSINLDTLKQNLSAINSRVSEMNTNNNNFLDEAKLKVSGFINPIQNAIQFIKSLRSESEDLKRTIEELRKELEDKINNDGVKEIINEINRKLEEFNSTLSNGKTGLDESLNQLTRNIDELSVSTNPTLSGGKKMRKRKFRKTKKGKKKYGKRSNKLKYR
tara:strand:+ start:838 stop:1329 length:492 start_codon:yes stop_codon:yes gene_type:complete